MKLNKQLAPLAAGIAMAVTVGAAQADSITVVSWGGAYTKSQVEAYHKPWIASSGHQIKSEDYNGCLLYTSPSPRDRQKSRMPSSA